MISRIMTKMLCMKQSTIHDINHLMKVWGYARTIGRMEGLDDREQFIVEAASILHDIACPLLRPVYGHSPWELQEQQGAPMAMEFLEEFDFPNEDKNRIVYLVGHHHTLTDIDGLDYRILVEADFLVNADEGKASTEEIKDFYDTNFRTKTGKTLLSSIYRVI